MSDIFIRLPAEQAADFREFWRLVRIADALPPKEDLSEPETVERFDGNAIVEWVIPLTKAVAPLISAVLGYLVARRGEVEIKKHDAILKFRNLTPRQIKEVLRHIEEEVDREKP